LLGGDADKSLNIRGQCRVTGHEKPEKRSRYTNNAFHVGLLSPKLSDFVDAHRVPLGSAVRMGRRNLFAGRLNGSMAAQILIESPGRQRPTTETADAACEEVLETPEALTKPRSLLRRPMRTADPSGPFRKNQN